MVIGRVEEDDVAGRRRAVRMEDVAGEDRRACFLAEVPDVGAADLDGRPVVFPDDGLRRAAPPGLAAESAGSREGCEHARPQHAAVTTRPASYEERPQGEAWR